MSPDPIRAIKEAVDEYGSQTKFAKSCGVTQAYVSQVLSGKTPPSVRLLSAVGLRRAVVSVDGGSK